MAWTAPMTAVENAVWTSSQWNTHVRDNLLETQPAKATAASRYIVTNGTNSVAERVPATASVTTSQTTTSASYTALATSGPAVTVTTGTKALVLTYCLFDSNNANSVFASHAVSGATSISSSDNWAVRSNDTTLLTAVAVKLQTLTAGSNTFTMQYRTNSGATGTYANRRITVLPF